ncbi:MAG: twin-arginine translocation signal domain-containing protein [Verrucomicrobiales bacterium]|nr:twin-arginine translocation signal domain-containing protein [Verrucomicrobiales bacterium]
MTTRRHFLKSTGVGAGGLALSPSFYHLLAAATPSEYPHRFIFIRKSNGNLPKLCELPTFSDEEKKKEEEKLAFEADLDRHDLPVWLEALEGHKENMTILNGISMTMSGGGHYSFSGCMGAYRAGP